MSEKFTAIILKNIRERLQSELNALESELPEEMRQEKKDILGQVYLSYPALKQLYELSLSIEEMEALLSGE